MLNTLDLYYFSPTGGTWNVASVLASALAESVMPHNLASRVPFNAPEAELVLLAAPVYGGRIPAPVAEKVRQLSGAGKRAVTLAVYGSRAYEDALLELNLCAIDAGFTVVASGAFVAEHSISRAVAEGRPDGQDDAELAAFAQRILAKLESGDTRAPVVPGNYPHKEAMNAPFTPIFLPNCGDCGKCMRLCPTAAITRDADGKLVTDAARCILCMACVAACPRRARVLPPPVQAAMDEKLSPLKSLRRENEIFI